MCLNPGGAFHVPYCGRVQAVLPGSPPTKLNPTIWFVGLTTLDVIHRGVAPQHRNQKVTATWQGVSAGGPAANAAVVAAALGAHAVLFTALGSSPAAAIARADLEAHGVTVVDLADAAFQLAVSAILVDEATSERSVVSLDGGAHPVPMPQSLQLPEPKPVALLLDGHHPNLAHYVANQLSNEVKIVLDGGRWKPIFAELIPMSDVAALSSEFHIPSGDSALPDGPQNDEVFGVAGAAGEKAEVIDGALALGADGVVDAALALGAKAVVVTRGAEPVEWNDGQLEGRIIVPPVHAKDTLGAGDAFHGALTYYLAAGQDLPTAIGQANQVAATKVQHLGNRDWLQFI